MERIKPEALIVTGTARALTTVAEPGDAVTATRTPHFWALVNNRTGDRAACTTDFLQRFVVIQTQISGPQAGKDATQ